MLLIHSNQQTAHLRVSENAKMSDLGHHTSMQTSDSERKKKDKHSLPAEQPGVRRGRDARKEERGKNRKKKRRQLVRVVCVQAARRRAERASPHKNSIQIYLERVGGG